MQTTSSRPFLNATTTTTTAVRTIFIALAIAIFTAPAAFGYCSPTSDTANCLERTLPALPAGGGKFTDPDFGTEIMRLTDANDGTFCYTPYSYWPAFNRDATRVLVQCVSPTTNLSAPYFYGFNPTTFTRGARTAYVGSPAMNFDKGYYWDKTNSSLIYAFASRDTKLYRYNVATGEQLVVNDFASVIGAGRHIEQPSMSDDLSIIGFNVMNTANGSNYGYMVYKRTTSTVLLYVNDTSIDEVHISKNGQYASVDLYPPQAVRVWNLANTSASQYLPYDDPAEGLSHNTVKSNYIVGLTNYNISTVSRWEFSNLQRTTLLPLGFSHTGVAHVSGLMDDDSWSLVSLSDKPPATVSTGYDASATTIVLSSGHYQRLPLPEPKHNGFQFDAVWWNQTDYPRGPASDPNREIIRVTYKSNDTLTVVRGQQGTAATPKNMLGKTYRLLPTGPFHGEIFLMKTDGSGQVKRLVHHRAQYIDYYDSNFGNISRDGRFVAFVSNWDNSGRRDLFIARIPLALCPTNAQAVVWTDLSNAKTGSNGAITKTPNGSDWPQAAANSTQSLTGDGYFDCYINHNGAPNLYPINVGLNSGDTATFEYYWAISAGNAQAYVNNNYEKSTPVMTGDKLRIEVESGVVKFYKNAEWIHTSKVAPAFPLKARFGASLDNAGLSSASFFGAK